MTCAVPECPDPVHARGLCNKHRMRLQRFGSLEAKVLTCRTCGGVGHNAAVCPSRLPLHCDEPGCKRKVLARRLCKRHYEQWWKRHRARYCRGCKMWVTLADPCEHVKASWAA